MLYEAKNEDTHATSTYCCNPPASASVSLSCVRTGEAGCRAKAVGSGNQLKTKQALFSQNENGLEARLMMHSRLTLAMRDSHVNM